jgi:hypothetical protein
VIDYPSETFRVLKENEVKEFGETVVIVNNVGQLAARSRFGFKNVLLPKRQVTQL